MTVTLSGGVSSNGDVGEVPSPPSSPITTVAIGALAKLPNDTPPAENATIFREFEPNNLETIAQKIIMLSTRANVIQTFVGGNIVATH